MKEKVEILMKRSVRFISLFLAFLMIASLLASCTSPRETDAKETEPSIPADEYTLPKEEGFNQLTLYWKHSGSYENCDIWIWWADKAGAGYRFHECAYGGKVVVNVPKGVSEVGFIVRKNCSEPGGTSWGNATKDYDTDRFAILEGEETVIYLKSGDPMQYQSEDGGKTLETIKKFSLAGMTDLRQIQYRVTPKTVITALSQVKVYEGEREIEVVSLSSLGRETATGYIEVAEDLKLDGNYRVVIEGFGERAVLPTKIFDSDTFASLYHYDGDDLGAVIHGDKTTFKVWAPTASRVVLNLFEAGNGVEAYKNVDMVRAEKGVWTYTEECGHGTYYTYSVTTAVGTQEAVDPYAKAAGVNGKRGMVVDLSLTDPEGFRDSSLADPIKSYSDAIIWEVHVRDFSNKIASSQYKGKYLAFTERGLVNEEGQSVGIDYLVSLGITHVHLLPVYDYASVDESVPNSGFNWGYDPENYNVPEGSYATDPYHGEVRIKEYKQMVQALHDAGIGVVMDVVYNHTYDANSSFNKIVPYYYYRYTDAGVNSSASGCGNDTASERYMFGKFMVDSTAYWVEEYKLDGLRFDLMGLHDLDTMQRVESAVHTINPNALIYGEGWTMGFTVDGSAQANQSNISKIVPTGDAIGGIAVFNDAIRDGLKGSVFEKTARGYINGAPRESFSKVAFGMKGGVGVGQGWSVENAMVINYMSAHDNNTLWDKLILSNGDADDETRAKMNRLGAAILLMSKGTPFWQAGEEMLRTKGGDENSYKSSDEVNNIDWSVLAEGTLAHETMAYYKGLIEMRKTFSPFTASAAVLSCEEHGSGMAKIMISDGEGGEILAVLNPYGADVPFVLEGEWNLVADGTRAGGTVLARESGDVTVSGYSVRVYVNDALVK